MKPNPEMDDRSSPDPSEVEASEEFPILYGLLTAADTESGTLKRKQQGINSNNYSTNSNSNSSTTARYFQGSRRRRLRRPSFSSSSSETVMEPDSSTTDDLEPIISPSPLLLNPPTTTLNNSNINNNNNSSPLLVLRLTATAPTTTTSTTSNKQFSNSNNPKRQQYQIFQSGSSVRGVRKTSRSKKQTENEEPSSTTSEDIDGEVPLKIRRISTESNNNYNSNSNVSNPNGGTLRALLSKDRGSCFGHGQEQSHINCYSNLNEDQTAASAASACRRLQRIGIDFFPCNNCDLNFTKLQHLELHQSYHTNKKLYNCSHCSSSFYLKKSLQNHESKHHGLLCKNNLAGNNLLFDHSSLSRLVFRKPTAMPDAEADSDPEESSSSTNPNNINLEGNHHHCDLFNNSFQPFQLPIDLEITKVPDSKNQLLSKLLDMKTSESAYEVSINNNNKDNKDNNNIIELLIPKHSSSPSVSTVAIGNVSGNFSSKNYPCGHCTEEFDSLSSLLKHTARAHVPKGGIGGDTFHIEIETRD